MSDRSDNGGIVALLLFAAGYAVYKIVEVIVAAVTALLMGLVNILLIVAGILALVLLYRFITDQHYGASRNARRIEKWERQRKELKSRVPKHLKAQVDEYFKSKQSELFDLNPRSRGQTFVENLRQFFSQKAQE